MERTPRLFRMVIESLPPAPDATIILPDAGGAVDEEQSAEFHRRAVDESGRTEGGLSGRAGIQAHHVAGYLQGGAGGQDANAEDGEIIGRAVPQTVPIGRAVPCTTVPAMDESCLTERGLSGRAGTQVHRVSGNLRQGGAGRQEPHPVAEDQELNARTVPETQSVPAVERGLGGLAGSPEGSTIGYSDTRYDQYMDLYLYGRPVSDFWETLWSSSPLVFHDMELLSIRRYIASCRRNIDFSLDLTTEISSVLDKHPGPVSSFRIDSCIWTGGSEKLGQWLEILSAHKVQKLIVFNKVLPTTTVFPVNMLQCQSLNMLCVAFMDIPNLGLGAFSYCSLDTLELNGCTYCSKGLSSLVSDCTCLRCLVLGCSHEDISITSQSLMSVQIWNCTGSFLKIDYAPKLLTLATGIRPKEGLYSVMLSVNTVEALTELGYLMLPFHDFTISSKSVIEGVVALPQLRRVRLGIQMGNAHQRDGLVNILKRMPRLTHLVILTVEDSATTDEEFDGTVVASALGPASDSGPTALGSLSCDERVCNP